MLICHGKDFGMKGREKTMVFHTEKKLSTIFFFIFREQLNVIRGLNEGLVQHIHLFNNHLEGVEVRG